MMNASAHLIVGAVLIAGFARSAVFELTPFTGDG
jgi:hypothetical protein